MAVLKINYASADYAEVISDQSALNSFLSKILKSASPAIIEHLTRYHSQKGDTCHIDNFEVTSSQQTDHTNGNVVISYVVQYVYACADITRQAKDHETWRFEINDDSNTLLLYMPEYEVRSTHDEF